MLPNGQLRTTAIRQRVWLAVAAALLVATRLLSASPTPGTFVPLPLQTSLLGASRGGFQAPTVDDHPEFVSVVAADIDADGDIDIVAASGSLELFVWTNDGAGHLTRQAPHRVPGWRSTPGAPTVSPLDATSVFFVQNDSPSPSHVFQAGAVLLTLPLDSPSTGRPLARTTARHTHPSCASRPASIHVVRFPVSCFGSYARRVRASDLR